jgi:hypothetical protein
MGKFVFIEITSWQGISLGATHYYGKLKGYDDNNEVLFIDIEKPLGEKEAKKLSKKDDFTYREGTLTARFDSKQEVIDIAIEKWKTYFPNAEFLIQGEWAIADPQNCLIAPNGLKEKINKLYLESEEIGGYEKSPKRMDEIFREYQNLIREYK